MNSGHCLVRSEDDKVDDMPLASRRRRSPRLAGALRELNDAGGNTEDKNETEDEEDENETAVVDHPIPGTSKQVSKRQMDNLVADGGGSDSSQNKRIKKAELVKDQKDPKRDLTPATPYTSPSRSSNPASSVAIAGPSTGSLLSRAAPSIINKAGRNTICESSVKNPTACEIQEMEHIQSVMNELKNVPDITEMINDDTDQTTANFEQSSSSVPAMVSEGMDGRFQTVNFYWLDMFEDPESPGVLFIFGKVKSPPPGNDYSSGCIVVKNLNRRVFLLPRETRADGTPVDYMNVYNEFYTKFAAQLKIPAFKCKRSKRRYCFDIEGIPPEAEYMEVRYSGSAPVLPKDVNGETFSHAFGTNTSLMETFLLDKKLKGPAWLQLSYCERVQPDQQQSWSKFEFTCDASNVEIHPDASKFPVPTLVLGSLQTETIYNSDLKRRVFVFAGVAAHRNFKLQLPSPPNEVCHDFFCFINKPPGCVWPNGVEDITNKRILQMDSESSMLECLVSKLHELDVDVYLDYGTELEGLLKQLSDLKVPNRTRFGRLKKPVRESFAERNFHSAIRGRLLCDMATSRIPQIIGNRSAFLKKRNGKEEIVSSLASSEMKALFKSSEDLISLVKWGMKHCVLKIREVNELQVLPLVFQKACIAGSTLFRAFNRERLYRSEHLILHSLSAQDYIVPDGCQSLQDDVAAEIQVVQDVTSEVEEGFYENCVLQLNFSRRWLYPCALTKFQAFPSSLDADDGTEEPRRTMQNELRKLGESRKQVESLMKMKDVTEDEMRQYEIQLKSLNSTTLDVMRDCCRNSRFRSKTVKLYLQAQVQEFLLTFKETVRKMGFTVIYGNECSVMIKTFSCEISEVLEIEKKIQEEIRRTYSPRYFFSNEFGIYRRLLLLKDNKYAGLLYNPNSVSKYEVDLEHFAIDPSGELPIVVSKTARACLIEIFSELSLNDKMFKVGKILWDVSSRLRYGALPFEELLVSKKLAKNPEEYDNSQGLHHVTVALRINKNRKLGKKFRKGDQVSYVLCKDGCPRHLSEINCKKDQVANVKTDADYYLVQMIHPVVSEICERIPGLGLDSARVKDALGLGG